MGNDAGENEEKAPGNEEKAPENEEKAPTLPEEELPEGPPVNGLWGVDDLVAIRRGLTPKTANHNKNKIRANPCETM